MKRKLKPTITYIKNGVEKTVTLNFFNKRRILKKILKISREWHPKYDEFIYEMHEDIEFVHFKNCSFVDLEKFKSPHDNLCIFEDCTFQRKNDHKISFAGGTYELIDPVFKNIKTIESYKENVAEVSIIYKKQNKETTPSEKLITTNVGRNYVNSMKIEDNCNFEEIITLANKTQLNNNFELEFLELDNDEEITIGNKKTDTNMKITWGHSRIRAEEKINLTNCKIENTDGGIFISSPEVEVENVELKARGRIKVNDNIYDPKENESIAIVTDKDIAGANLISTLKAYKNKINKQIKTQTDTILESEYKQLKQKERCITKSLSKKPIKNIMKK